jgi:hypothetical protein
LSLSGDHDHVDTVVRQTHMAGARDTGVRKLRDVTIAIAIAAAAGVGVFGFISAATLPGSTVTAAPTGNAATGIEAQPIAATGDGFAQAPPQQAQFGSGVAVTGGSH